jgi:hypothetical protein
MQLYFEPILNATLYTSILTSILYVEHYRKPSEHQGKLHL